MINRASRCSVGINAGIDDLDLFAQVALEVAVRSGDNSPAGAFADRIGVSVASGAQLSQHGEQPVAALDLAPAGLASGPVGRLISFQEGTFEAEPNQVLVDVLRSGPGLDGPDAWSCGECSREQGVAFCPRESTVSSPSCESRSKAT